MMDKPQAPLLSALLDEFVQSLRPDQMQQLVARLSPEQESLFEALLLPELGPNALQPWRKR
jgi:hypothetical protein